MTMPLTLLSSGAAFHRSRSWEYFGVFFYCTKISSEPRQDVEQRYNTFRPAAVIEIIFCLLLYREEREKLFLGENIFAVYRRFMIPIIPCIDNVL